MYIYIYTYIYIYYIYIYMYITTIYAEAAGCGRCLDRRDPKGASF